MGDELVRKLPSETKAKRAKKALQPAIKTKRRLASIPTPRGRGLDPEVVKFLNSVREDIQVIGGLKGDPLDRAVTVRELVDANIVVEIEGYRRIEPNADLAIDSVAKEIINLPSIAENKGLKATDTYLGYYDGNSWMAYIDNEGRFFFGGATDANYIQWDGTTLTILGTIFATAGNIGGWVLAPDALYKLDSGSLSSRDDGIVMETISEFTETDPLIAVYSSSTLVAALGNWANGEMGVYGISGQIGGWTLASTSFSGGNATLHSSGYLNLGTGNDIVKLSSVDGTYRIWVGHATAASAPFSVTKAGAIFSSSGAIAGWTIISDEISKASGDYSITLSSSDTVVEVANSAVSAGEVWYINMGQLRDTAGALTGNYGFGAIYQIGGTKFNVFEISQNQVMIAGWTFTHEKFYNGTDIVLDAVNKKISINDATVGNSGIQLDYNGGTPQFYVGDGADLYFSFIDDSGQKLSWKGVNTELTEAGQLSVANILATGGTIAGFTIDATEGFYAGTGATRIQMKVGTGLWLGATAFGDAPFSVSPAGAIKAESGVIAGWVINGDTLESDSATIVLDAALETITVGNIAADGMQISSTGIDAWDGGVLKGQWDVDSTWWLGPSSTNKKIGWVPEDNKFFVRGSAHFDMLVWDEVITTRGQIAVAKSGGEVYEKFDTPTNDDDTFTLKVKEPIAGGAPLADGDICKIDDGFNEFWFEIDGAGSDEGDYYLYENTIFRSGDAEQEFLEGTAIVDYGQDEDGGVNIVSSTFDGDGPYVQIFEIDATPWDNGLLTRARFGNLKSSYGYDANNYWGVAMGEYGAGKVNLTIDDANGFRIRLNTVLVGQWDTSGDLTLNDNAGNGVIKIVTDIGFGNKGIKFLSAGDIGSYKGEFITNAFFARLWLHQYSNVAATHPILSAGRARGTYATPLAVQANDNLFTIQSLGNIESVNFSLGPKIEFYANENWSAGNLGSRIEFYTIQDSAAVFEKVATFGDGDLAQFHGVTTFDSIVNVDGTLNANSALIVDGLLTANGGAVFNQDSADVDFRVESDNSEEAFFVRGSDGYIGFGTTSPDMEISNDTLAIHAYRNATTGAGFRAQSSNSTIELVAGNATNFLYSEAAVPLKIYTNGVMRQHITSAGLFGIGNITPTILLDVNEKAGMSAEGGHLIKLTNRTGGNSVEGELVQSAPGVDDAFITAAADELMVIGVVYEAGIADQSECWIVVGGIANVLIDGGGCDHGDRLVSSGTAGSAEVDNGPTVAGHFQEIGHSIETRVGAGLARAVLHFL